MVVATIKKWGNSLALRVPADVAKTLKLTEDGHVHMTVQNDSLIVTPIATDLEDQTALRALFLQLRSQAKSDKAPAAECFADPVGDEIV